jgi:hypothetical protein
LIGPKEEMKAKIIERKKMSIVCCQGKIKGMGVCVKRTCCIVILHEITTPINIPINEDANTSTKAS